LVLNAVELLHEHRDSPSISVFANYLLLLAAS